MTDQSNLQKMWEDPTDSGIFEEKPDKRLRPFAFLNMEDNKEISKWKKDFFIYSDQELSSRIEVWMDNLQMYVGAHFKGQNKGIGRNTEAKTLKRDTRKPFPIGITNELVEQKVSKVTANKLGIKALPPKNTYESRNSARLANKLIEYLEYMLRMEMVYEKFQRSTHIFGEMYAWSEWYPERGPIDPDYEKLVDKGEDPKRVKIYTDKDGNEVYADAVKRQGEVGVKLKYPWQVRSEVGKEWDDSDYYFVEEREYVEYVAAKWPDAKLENEDGQTVELEDLIGPDGKVPVFHFYHKETEFLDKGRKVVFVGDYVVENDVHPHNPNRHNIVRNVDIEIPGERFAISFIEIVKHLNRAYDGVTFLMLKAMAQGAHLKWIVPARSCNPYALADLATIVEYSGGVPPRLEMPRTLSPEMFQLRDALKSEIKELSGVHGVSFGDVPKRIDSSLAIQHLEEQETKRDRTTITRYRESIKFIWQNNIDIVGKHYDTDTERILRLVGPDDELSTETIKGSDIAGPFEIRIVGTSAMPDTIAGKTDYLVKLRETFPNLVPDQYVLDALEMAQPERYITYAAVAVRKAEAINDAIMTGKPVEEPQPYEELITHWQILMKLIQSQKFTEAPDKVQKIALQRVGAIEYLMWKRTTTITGRGFSQKLQALDGFPAVYSVPEPNPQEMAQGAPIPLQEGVAAQQAQPNGAAVVPPGAEQAPQQPQQPQQPPTQ